VPASSAFWPQILELAHGTSHEGVQKTGPPLQLLQPSRHQARPRPCQVMLCLSAEQNRASTPWWPPPTTQRSFFGLEQHRHGFRRRLSSHRRQVHGSDRGRPILQDGAFCAAGTPIHGAHGGLSFLSTTSSSFMASRAPSSATGILCSLARCGRNSSSSPASSFASILLFDPKPTASQRSRTALWASICGASRGTVPVAGSVGCHGLSTASTLPVGAPDDALPSGLRSCSTIPGVLPTGAGAGCRGRQATAAP
jgi:hypothetical protein